MITAIGVHVCWAQPQPPVRIQKAPAPVATNTFSAEELNRMTAEQTRILEKQNPWIAEAKTNKTFAQAMSYILAEMAGHKLENLPPGLDQSDISNAYFHIFLAPQMAHASKTAQSNPSTTSLSTASGDTQVTDLSNTVQRWSEQVQHPIEFYGKVVDDNGQAVQGANIEFIWAQIYPEGSFKTNALTDSGGLFSLRNVTGARLVVYVNKPGYDYVEGLNESSFSYSTTRGSELFDANTNNPVLFHLHRKIPQGN